MDRSANENGFTMRGPLSNNDDSLVSSSYNERVRRIQEKLQNMQYDIEADRNNKLA